MQEENPPRNKQKAGVSASAVENMTVFTTDLVCLTTFITFFTMLTSPLLSRLPQVSSFSPYVPQTPGNISWHTLLSDALQGFSCLANTFA